MASIQAGFALVLDDDPGNRDFLERLLRTARFQASSAATGQEGLRMARSFPRLALAMVDQELPDLTGLEVIARLRAENPEAILVMATMHDERSLMEQAFEAGVDVFLVKPHGFMELYYRLQGADSNMAALRHLIIDTYGPRPYRGDKKWKPPVKPPQQNTSAVPVVTAAEKPVQPQNLDSVPQAVPSNHGQAKEQPQPVNTKSDSTAPSLHDQNLRKRLP